jgi:hypothetical protein
LEVTIKTIVGGAERRGGEKKIKKTLVVLLLLFSLGFSFQMDTLLSDAPSGGLTVY